MPAISTGLAIGLGALSAGTSVVGGVLAKKGAESQAQAAEKASAEGVAEQKRQFDLSRQDLAPWISTGGAAVQQLGWLMGIRPGAAGSGTTASGGSPQPARAGLIPQGDRRFLRGEDPRTARFTALSGAGKPAGGLDPAVYDPATFGSLNKDFTNADFVKDPGYDFRLAEGQKAIERSAAARGGLFSGRQLKDTLRFGQDYASNEFSNAFNRFELNRTGKFNRYAALAGLGQQSASQLAAEGGATSRGIADTIIGGATSAAASRASGTNALAQGISGGIGSGLNWLLLSKIMKPS